ncbi:MAG: hypothetical protein AAB309_05345 [Deltaproteobacteria bacterium]
MRIRTFVATVVLLALVALVESYGQAGEIHKERGTSPTPTGRQGGAKVYSAEPKKAGSFGFGYQEEYFQSRTIPFSGRNHVHGGQIFINYAPCNFFQLFLNRKTILINNEDLFPLLQSHSFSKSEAGGTITIPFSGSYSLGVDGHYALFNGNGIEDIDKANSWGARLLQSWKTHILKRKYPLRLHFNTLYFKDRSHRITEGSSFEALHLLGISQFDMLQYGLGIELETSRLSPFVEYTLDHTLDSHIPIFKNPNRLTTGFKITPAGVPWQIVLGSDIGLSSKNRFDGAALTPKLNFFAGINYQTPKGKETVVKGGDAEKEKMKSAAAYPIYPVEVEDSEISAIQEEADLPFAIEPMTEEEMKKYPIYQIDEDSSASGLGMTMEPVKKVQKVKKVKKTKKEIKKEVIEEENVVITEPKQEEKMSEPEKKPELPQAKESVKELKSSPVQEKPEIRPSTPRENGDATLDEIFKSRSDSQEKGYQEDVPNKNFLLHFR